MNYLTLNDLKAHSYAIFIDDSATDFIEARDLIETQMIARIKSKLNSRFDVDAIFEQTGTDRSPLILEKLTAMVIYKLLKRNAARKIPSTAKDDYDEATQWLTDVRDHKENPKDLPLNTDDNGIEVVKIRTGNNKNENYYL